MNKLYIIKNKCTVTGHTGQSGRGMSKDVALAWVTQLNTMYPTTTHWVEEVLN